MWLLVASAIPLLGALAVLALTRSTRREQAGIEEVVTRLSGLDLSAGEHLASGVGE